MSRRSQAFSSGVPAFSWRVERLESDAEGHGTRFKCTCRNHPAVAGFGDSEETAIRAASKAMETAVDKAEVGMVAAHQVITPDGVA